MFKEPFLKYNLQLFAEGGDNSTQQNQTGDTDRQDSDGNAVQNSGNNKSAAIDYDKIQSMIDKGTQQKAESTPDVAAIQAQLQQSQALAQQAVLEKDATLEAIALGLDTKQVPYILKMADLSNVAGEDGRIKDGAIKEAINKVLEDFPQLKPQRQENKGFQQVGAGGGSQANPNMEDALKKAFGL